MPKYKNALYSINKKYLPHFTEVRMQFKIAATGGEKEARGPLSVMWMVPTTGTKLSINKL